MDDGNGDGVHPTLCAAYRAGLEEKILNMEKSIRFSVYLSAALLGLALTLVNLYLQGIRS